MSTSDLISVDDAAKTMGVGRRKMLRAIRSHHLQRFEDPLDRRRFLLDRREIARLISPRPISSNTSRQLAA